MGVTDFLRTVIPSAGTEVDLRKYRDGIDVIVQDDKASPFSPLASPTTRAKKRRRLRRPLRIGVDISNWVYKACHRFGDMLANENHLTNYGRYQLVHNANNQNQNGNGDNQQQQQAGFGTAHSIDTLTAAKEENIAQSYVANCCLYVIERIQSLQREANAEVLVVLDGATPPIKLPTVRQRSDERRENARVRDAPVDMSSLVVTNDNNKDATTYDSILKEMEANLKERTKANRRAGAGKLFNRIIEELIFALRINTIPFMVAPYEADGQLAWLSKEKFIDLVITEDSDMVAQGGICMLYKMDLSTRCDSINSNNQQNDGTTEGKENSANKQQTGGRHKPSFVPKGILLLRDNLGAVTISKRIATGDDRHLCLRDLSDAMLAVMFVAAGSDYCESLKGIGLVTACDIVHKSFLQQSSRCPLKMVFEHLFLRTYDKTLQDDPARQAEYKKNFLAALLIYRHPIVYSPFRQRCIVALRDKSDPELTSYAPYRNLLDDEERLKEILGEIIEAPMATFIAEGWVSARNQQLYEFARKDPNLPKGVKEYFGLEDAGGSSTSKPDEKDTSCCEHKEEENIFDDAEMNEVDNSGDKGGQDSGEVLSPHVEGPATQEDTQASAESMQVDTQELVTEKESSHGLQTQEDTQYTNDNMLPQTQEM